MFINAEFSSSSMVVKKVFVLRIPKVVMPLIGINILMFILQNILGSSFTQALVLNTATVWTHPWTIITSMFLHGGFNHILFNMYALLMFGPLVEQRVGTKRFLQMYFISGILAALGFVFFQEVVFLHPALALGASGAIMGVFGMTIILLPELRILFFFIIPMSMRTAGIIFALIDLAGVFGVGVTGVANIAHLFGLAAGIAFAFYLKKKKKQFDKEFARPFVHHVHEAHSAKNYTKSRKDYNEAIELNEDDIQNYLKNGRL